MHETVYYIDMETMAKTMGISLQRAHKFIQPFLFAHGFIWMRGPAKEIRHESASVLFLEQEAYITYGTKNDMDSCINYKECNLFLKTI